MGFFINTEKIMSGEDTNIFVKGITAALIEREMYKKLDTKAVASCLQPGHALWLMEKILI